MLRYEKLRFWILVGIVTISGFSQGVVLPLISVLLENKGYSSSSNGFNAVAMYVGVLLISPIMEAPLRKLGYKPFLLIGGLLVALSLIVFPLFYSFWFWFFLRLIIGIGDHMLHFSSQTWITSTTPKNKLGKNLSLYGLFFGIGFAVGPLFTGLLKINMALPFIITSTLSLAMWLLAIVLLKNEKPANQAAKSLHISVFQSFNKFHQVIQYGWIALLSPFTFGFLEASLNSSFPIFALRHHVNVTALALIIPAFAIGSIVFQLPLGILSDKLGRHTTLLSVLGIGSICFLSAYAFQTSNIGLFISLFAAGMVIGSTYSLGISYIADLLPNRLIPAGNIMCGVAYSIGSMTGPFINGSIMQYFHGDGFFQTIIIVLAIIFTTYMWYRKKLNTIKEGATNV